MRYIFIEQHRREFPAYVMCRVLRVSRSGSYAWRHRLISAQRMRRDTLAAQIHHAHPTAPNMLDRQFNVTKLNTVWASDSTYVPTDDRWLYLAMVLDVCSRRVIGYAMSEAMKVSLTFNAL